MTIRCDASPTDIDSPLSRGKARDDAAAVAAIYTHYAQFVWVALQRFGVRPADLEDTLQEVFVVVHKRLSSFNGKARMTTWLYGISLRVASAYRRRAYVRREQLDPIAISAERSPNTPESELIAERARQRLQAVLDDMDIEKRSIFVMFEIDELPCESIATMLEVPLGTVHSRLHAARKNFQKALARFQAREAREGT